MVEPTQKSCTPCKGGVQALKGNALVDLHARLQNGWQVINEHHLKKSFSFSDFADGLAFADRIGVIAEREGHHPDINLTWGLVDVEIYTHKFDGLTESDFILAAKIDIAAGE